VISPDCEPVAADSGAVIRRIAPDSYIGSDELEPRKVAKKLEIDSLEARAGEYGGSAVDAMDDCLARKIDHPGDGGVARGLTRGARKIEFQL
jgi:hypothetical protein